MPEKLALTVWFVEEIESIVVATPFVLVVLCAGFTPPDVTAHVTTTPGTGWPLTSTAVTLNGVGSGLLKYQFCASPPLFRRSKGGRGWVVSALQADAATHAARACVADPVQRRHAYRRRERVVEVPVLCVSATLEEVEGRARLGGVPVAGPRRNPRQQSYHALRRHRVKERRWEAGPQAPAP